MLLTFFSVSSPPVAVQKPSALLSPLPPSGYGVYACLLRPGCVWLLWVAVGSLVENGTIVRRPSRANSTTKMRKSRVSAL